jgi:hypothetical protein
MGHSIHRIPNRYGGCALSVQKINYYIAAWKTDSMQPLISYGITVESSENQYE